MRSRAIRAAATVAAAVLLMTACGDEDGDGDGPDRGADGSSSGLEGEITVMAAASLTDAFDELGAAFEEANPDVTVTFNHDGSSSLRDQILAGAPADVFAAASTATMDAVAEAGGTAGDPQVFVTNELEIAVPAGNEAGVDGLHNFGDDSLLIGLCAEEVPCGSFGREALASAGVTPAPDTDEPDVRSLLDKVASGELDAGIVYVTDVLAAGDDVEGVEIPEDQNVTAEYPIATLTESGNAEVADEFVAFVLSDEGLEILTGHGFGPPPR